MKYAIIIPDGCADDPVPALDDRTPLQAADLPNMDRIAKSGVVGRANFVPPTLPPGSDVANLGLLGCNPLDYYTGRAPLEAAALGIELGPHDWAVRCNMVTIRDGIMENFSAGHISTEESGRLLATLQERVDGSRYEFKTSVGYRNLLICRGTEGTPVPLGDGIFATPPHDISDNSVLDWHPRGPGSDALCELMDLSREVFADHPVNAERIASGKLPATNVWLWGMGRRPSLPTFGGDRGLSGVMITGVDLLRGIGGLLGWKVLDVPGATGYFDTDYAAKGRTAVEAIDEVDVVCVHIEAPDEAGHDGNPIIKRDSLESIDREIVGPVLQRLEQEDAYRILVTPDHPTPVAIKTHTYDAVPWTICGTGIEPDGSSEYDETVGDASGKSYVDGWTLMNDFLG